MPYDPFYVANPQDGDVEVKKRKLISVRRPPLFDVPLTKLEWNNGDLGHRKRAKPESHLNASASRGEASESWQNHMTQSTGKSAGGTTRDVVRVVEKIVHVEPTTIMGVPPLVDDRVRYVVNFILEHVNSPNVEVEAKLGTLIEKSHGVRAIELVPVLCETPIRSESNKDTRFQSDVGGEVFTRLNSRLNQRVESTSEQEQGRIHYLRTREMDVFWPGRVRETKVRRNAPDGSEQYETIRVQSKKRLGDLNVLCPNKIADIRYSASMEQDCNIPPNSTPQMQRIKDRISYKYEYLSIDITCVEMQNNSSLEPSTTFEVEVEIDPTTDLFGEVLKYRHGDETSKLFDIAGSLVNTVRLLLEE